MRLRQEDCTFKVSLLNLVRSCLKILKRAEHVPQIPWFNSQYHKQNKMVPLSIIGNLEIQKKIKEEIKLNYDPLIQIRHSSLVYF